MYVGSLVIPPCAVFRVLETRSCDSTLKRVMVSLSELLGRLLEANYCFRKNQGMCVCICVGGSQCLCGRARVCVSGEGRGRGRFTIRRNMTLGIVHIQLRNRRDILSMC